MDKSVIIVDDHHLFAKSLEIMVNSFDEYSVMEIFSNGKEVVHYLNAGNVRPDIILLDIKMPVLNGMETMKWIKEKFPRQKVLALSMEDDETTVLAMLRLGVKGYLLKDIEPEEFFFALESVINEGYYHSELQKKSLESERKGKIDNLSDMEKEFLELSCSELTYKQISDEMGRSYKTIDGYREALFKRLNIKSRTGLALYAIKHNLVSL